MDGGGDRDEAGGGGDGPAVGDGDNTGGGPGGVYLPVLEDGALGAQDGDGGVLGPGDREAVETAPVGFGEEHVTDGGVVVDEGHARSAGFGKRDAVGGLEPAVKPGGGQEAEDRGDDRPAEGGLPLEDEFLSGLGDEAIENEATGDGGAEPVATTKGAVAGPHPDGGGVGDPEATAGGEVVKASVGGVPGGGDVVGGGAQDGDDVGSGGNGEGEAGGVVEATEDAGTGGDVIEEGKDVFPRVGNIEADGAGGVAVDGGGDPVSAAGLVDAQAGAGGLMGEIDGPGVGGEVAVDGVAVGGNFDTEESAGNGQAHGGGGAAKVEAALVGVGSVVEPFGDLAGALPVAGDGEEVVEGDGRSAAGEFANDLRAGPPVPDAAVLVFAGLHVGMVKNTGGIGGPEREARPVDTGFEGSVEGVAEDLEGLFVAGQAGVDGDVIAERKDVVGVDRDGDR